MKVIYLLAELVYLSVCVKSQSPVFVIDPVSIAAIDGTTVEFSCIANNTEDISYRVNGTSATVQDVQEKGFVQISSELLNGALQRRNLTVIVSSQYNNTEIFCRAIGTKTNSNSETATLIVQGPLSSVGDLSYSFIDSSIVNISWSPPFTLPGTAITGYNVSVINNGTATNHFISDSYYVLQLSDITDSPCNETNITVSGYNGFNGGSDLISGIYLPSVPQSEAQILVSFQIRNSQLRLTLNVTTLCIGERPSTANVDLLSSDTLVVHSVDNAIFYEDAETNALTITTEIAIQENQIYFIIVSLSNLGGDFNTKSAVRFTTFGVQSVVITDTTGIRVCLKCSFSPFSTDTGCTVELVSSASVQYADTFNRSGNTAEGCVEGVKTGQYDIRVYDQDSDVLVLTLTKVIVSVGMIDSSTPATTYTSIVRSSSSVTNSSNYCVLPSTTPLAIQSGTLFFGIAFIVGVLTSMVLIVIIILCFRIHHRLKSKGKQAYEIGVDLPKSLSKDRTILTGVNPAYGEVGDTRAVYHT